MKILLLRVFNFTDMNGAGKDHPITLAVTFIEETELFLSQRAKLYL